MQTENRNIATAAPISYVERLAMTQRIIDEMQEAQAKKTGVPTLKQAKEILAKLIKDNCHAGLGEFAEGEGECNKIRLIAKFIDSLDESK